MMNAVFQQLAFWNLFSFLEREDLSLEDIEAQFELLSQDFYLHSERHQYNHDGQHFDEEDAFVVFEFDLNADYCLQLEYYPHPGGGAKYLWLSEKKQEERHLMGWWDLARWHPYCLRQSELEQLCTYWKKQPNSPWAENDLPLLLLHDFVGFDKAEEAETFAQKIFNTFKTIKIEGFEEAEQKPIAVFYQEEEQFRWTEDPKLGWLFQSPVYACYSLRNLEHKDGKEAGRFPFEAWKKVINDLLLKS